MLNNMRESETTEITELMDRVRSECNAEHSPSYSNKATSWTWNQFTGESNYRDSSNEIVGLMEDKEIAARAVAFVVNSTRKGIIPLCADVAHLMRSKQSLERKLYMLKKENEAFRSSSAASFPSHSMSPTPPSLSSYTENCIKALQEQSLAVQELYRSNSRCSDSSSTYSYSPKLDKPRGGNSRLFGVQYSPVTDHENRKIGTQRFKHSVNSSFQMSQSSNSKINHDIKCNNTKNAVTKSDEHDEKTWNRNDNAASIDDSSDQVDHKINASTEVEDNPADLSGLKLPEYTNAIGNMVSALEDESKVSECKSNTNGNLSNEYKEEGVCKKEMKTRSPVPRSLLERRRVSLPEMTSLPSEHAMRVRPKQSKQIQCCMTNTETDQAMEDQFLNSVRVNAKLEEELNVARQEIDHLKKRISKMEACGAIPKSYSNYHEDDKNAEDNGYYTGSNRTSRNSSEHEKSSGLLKGSKSHTTAPVSYKGPLPGCKCSACQEAMGSEDDLSHYCDQYLEEPARYTVNGKLQVQIGDHVTTKHHKSGYVRYIGHVDKLTNQTSSLFIGLEADDQAGGHDGFYRGKRYYYCKDKHGVFIPLVDVISKVGKKTQSKTAKEDYLKVKKHSRKPPSKEEKLTHL